MKEAPLYKPMGIKVTSERDEVVLVIESVGALKMPADAAHAIARELMIAVDETVAYRRKFQ